MERINLLMTINRMSATTFNRKDLRFTCCGKVNASIGGENVFGYVIDESEQNLVIKLENNEVKEVSRPRFDSKIGKHSYEYRDSDKRGDL